MVNITIMNRKNKIRATKWGSPAPPIEFNSLRRDRFHKGQQGGWGESGDGGILFPYNKQDKSTDVDNVYNKDHRREYTINKKMYLELCKK